MAKSILIFVGIAAIVLCIAAFFGLVYLLVRVIRRAWYGKEGKNKSQKEERK